MNLLTKIAVIGGVIVLLFVAVFCICRCRDGDMNPAVKEGDLAISYRWDKTYNNKDVIIAKAEGKKMITRVIATPGDTVDITEQGLVINGFPQEEKEIYEETIRYQEGIDFPITLKEGEFFVLGDARKTATDSRIFGVVDKSKTYGKVMVIIKRRNF